MSINEKIKKMIEGFLEPRKDEKKKIDNHLEKAYKKKEASLTDDIKAKTREFKRVLLEHGFMEAEFYVEDRLWKWKYYKETAPDVAFIVNLEPYDDYLEIYYGYASTAFTKMAGCADTLRKYGVDSDGINVRKKAKYVFGDSENPLQEDIKAFHDEHFHLSKEEILNLQKAKAKEFINKINLILKPLGFKKKGNAWTISLINNYVLSFYASKERYCDTYRFSYSINNLENKNPINCCLHIDIGYEYKSQRYDYNWQCYSDAELDAFLDFIKEEILSPIMAANLSELKKLISELNSIYAPRLFMPTNREVRYYGNFTCNSTQCADCYKNV